MDEQAYIRLTEANFERRIQIHKQRSTDYTAGSDDVLLNFKKVAQICHILGVDFTDESDAAMFHVIHKIVREMQLKKAVAMPQSESREDTLLDLANYVDLYAALAEEERHR